MYKVISETGYVTIFDTLEKAKEMYYSLLSTGDFVQLTDSSGKVILQSW